MLLETGWSVSTAEFKQFPSHEEHQDGSNGSKHSHHGNFLSYTHWDLVCQSLSPESPPISISLPTYLTTSSGGPLSELSIRCLHRAVITAVGGKVCVEATFSAQAHGTTPCNILWESMRTGRPIHLNWISLLSKDNSSVTNEFLL